MSEPKIISPLLDGFSMGNPVSEHNGIRCCPAIKENSDKKYIVKIISIPASQVQMDALLLAGAYKDPADAMEYYKQVGEDLLEEAAFLKKLSKLNGFLSYEDWQMVPITRKRLGYEVYLLGSYKRTLDKVFRQNPVTHLEAMNLALDLCSALSVSRDAGALYVDLKPSNIFISEKKEYRIGDLGFIQLDALSYTSLPEKYHSQYTPPELFDPMAPLNLTIDSYGVGMILYQLYNDGQLPFLGKAPEEGLPSPINADYELAEIIMKAIHPDPSQRWDHPKDLGKAIAAYMQKNAVNDVPITPYTPLDVAPEDVMLVKKAAAEGSEQDETLSDEIHTLPEGEDGEASPVGSSDEKAMEDHDSEAEETEGDSGHTPAEEAMPVTLSEEMTRIISKADDLIEHEVPEGVILPEVPETPDPFSFASEISDEIDDSDIPADAVMESLEVETQAVKKTSGRFRSAESRKKLRKLISRVCAMLVLAVMVAAGILFYQHIYLQNIDSLVVEGKKDKLTVSVEAKIDPEKLTVVCADTYGNAKTSKIENGQAVFTDLIPNTMYAVRLEVEGFHKLVGQTSGYYNTEATTQVVSFTAVTGDEDGSVILNMSVTGDEPETWTVVYGAEGEEARREPFSGHSVHLKGLSLGKVYTFALEADGELSLSGETELQFMPSRLIRAADLRITSSNGNDITVHWKAPGDIVVDSWEVRCYNDAGFEQQLSVTNTEVYFGGIDLSTGYTIEVTAAGMTQPARTYITADPIRITQWSVSPDEDGNLKVQWDYSGEKPDGGWLLSYSMDGGNTREVMKTSKSSAKIPSCIPGAKYQISLETADATSVLNNITDYLCPAAPAFEEHGLSAENVYMLVMKTPEKGKWDYAVFESSEHDQKFASSQPLSLALHAGSEFYRPGTQVEILFIIWDSYGNVRPELISVEHCGWNEIWEAVNYRYALLDIPKLPEYPGSYTLELLVNGQTMGSTEFIISD